MIRLSGYEPGTDIEIVITGALPGENLTEQVVGPHEQEHDGPGPIRTIEPVPVPRAVLDEWLDRLEGLAVAGDHGAARAALLELAGVALDGAGAPPPAPDDDGADGESVGRRARSLQARS
jgi:O-antigen biosynthesis protein WbqV